MHRPHVCVVGWVGSPRPASVVGLKDYVIVVTNDTHSGASWFRRAAAVTTRAPETPLAPSPNGKP